MSSIQEKRYRGQFILLLIILCSLALSLPFARYTSLYSAEKRTLSFGKHKEVSLADHKDDTLVDHKNDLLWTIVEDRWIRAPNPHDFPLHSVGSIHPQISSLRDGSFLGLGPPDSEFVLDVRRLMDQLSDNYALDSSSCPSTTVEQAFKNCFGIGSTLVHASRTLATLMLQGQIVRDVDENKSCKWLENDKTRECSSLWGDCYLPRLRWKRGNPPCQSVEWFHNRYGTFLYRSVVQSWALGGQRRNRRDLTRLERFHDIQTPSSSCLALIVRRGDACINPDRKCFGYDLYKTAVQQMLGRYPHLTRLVVMTDAHDFPLPDYAALFADGVYYSMTQDRSVFNVWNSSSRKFIEYAPEFRNLANTTSEFFVERVHASQCVALVGTFSSAVTKIVFVDQLVQQGRVPPYISLDGCPRQATTMEFLDNCLGPGSVGFQL